MRDYALTLANGFEQASGNLVSRLWTNWKARREISHLSQFDDYMLRDIGVSREDVNWAADLPISVNPGVALEQRVFNRSRKWQ